MVNRSTCKRPFSVVLQVAMLLWAGRFASGMSPEFEADVKHLTRAAHRLTGTQASRDALDVVERRLAEIGPDQVIVQEFPTVQMRIKRCDVELADGRLLPLLPMRPNGIILPVTPTGGLSGPFVHAGDGAAEQFLDRSVEGAIVVLDYNSGENWLRAFRLGASAVIFVASEAAKAWHSHWVEANVDIPRFYYEGPRSDLPEGEFASIHSALIWEPAVGRNLFATFEGRDAVFGQEREEVVILAVPTDTFGEVPTLSQGARGAANIAGLLKLAGYIKENRPRRHVLLAFLDAQAQGHLGAGQFFRALETSDGAASVEGRRKSYEAETAFLDEMWTLFESELPLEVDSFARRQLLNRLRDRAAERAYGIGDVMFDRRKERMKLAPAGSEHDTEAVRARRDAITRELEDVLQVEKDAWNDVRRALGKDRTENVDSKIRNMINLLIADVRENVRLRKVEMELERRALDADQILLDLMKDKWVSLHASLLLGDTTTRWGLVIGGSSAYHSDVDNPGLYGKVQSVFVHTYDALVEDGKTSLQFERASADQTLSQAGILWAAPHLVHSGEIAGLFGIYNLCLATCQESLEREGTPSDTLADLKLERIASQVDDVCLMLTEVASQESLSLRRGIVARSEYSLPKFSGETVTGPTVMGLLPGSSIPNLPLAGAVLQFSLTEAPSLAYQSGKPYAFQNYQVRRTTRNGTYELGPIRGGWGWEWSHGFAAMFDEQGRVKAVSDSDSDRTVRRRLNMFRANPGWIVLPPMLNTQRNRVGEFRLLSARDNGELPKQKSYFQLGDGIAGWYAEEREEGVKLFNLDLNVSLNSGSGTTVADGAAVTPLGVGFAMGNTWASIPSSRRSALDLWNLNNSRLELLQGKNIVDSSLAELHGRAEDLLIETVDVPVTLRSEAMEASSFMASRPVYNKTRSMVDDLVFAVLILLGISVPFAFAMERVTIGATTIYKQMTWFSVFFVGTFVLLFLTHPAFAIANTPIIIFLGFAILILSVLVISIIVRRFETELKDLQGMPSTVHAADVSKVGTMMAAMHMGISTMRRRPLRTALTAVTIILLTFTILSFASFGIQSGVVRLFSAPVPAYSGVFVHGVNWEPLGADIMDVVEGRWGGQGDVHTRHWISPREVNASGLLLSREDGTHPVTVKGVLGIDAEEIRRRPDLLKVFDEAIEGKILMTPSVARALGVSEGDSVLFAGTLLRVGRAMDPVAVSVVTDMDGSSILPVDFTEARSNTGSAEQSLQASLSAAAKWTSLPVDDVVVVSADLASRLGADLRGWTVYTPDITVAAEVAEDMARMLPLPVAATLKNGVFRHILGTVVAASGTSDLLFPILLGGLVIFGTMLGSVADREREIYTFSALGLAPRHVATLFVAEAIVYSLIGGMGGYLLAQGVVRVLHILAAYGWVQAPEMNMSSTNTIVTILIVMATVMVSAIYPAIKASKSANPGLMRSWQPPEPVGNLLDMVFPFTVSDYDITGVVSFLKEHFDNHSDVGLGHFMAQDTRILREEDGVLGVRTFLTLAPFDLGVSQHFAMRSVPSEIPGIDEVRISLERATGQPKDWNRLNRVLLDDLRRQFLFWRALPEETMDIYRQRTLGALEAESGATER